MLVERVEYLCDYGFLPAINKVSLLAKELLARRDARAAEVMCGRGRYDGFRKCHPMLVTKWTSQMDMIRALRGDDVEFLTST